MYTATNNPTATYGEQSPSVLALQQSLNKKYTGQPGYVPLKEDSKYGPMTLEATKYKPQSSLIVTSGQSRTKFNQNSADLDAALSALNGTQTTQNPDGSSTTTTTEKPTTEYDYSKDPIMQSLNTLQANSDAATKSLLATTAATYQNKINGVSKQYDNYKRGLQLLGIQHNEAQATPDLLAGHIQQAANDQREKIDALTAEENKALIDAKSAKDSNDFKLLGAKMDYIKQIKDQKSQAIKDMYDSISNADKTSAIEAHNIYDTMLTLNPDDQEQFILAVAKKYNLPVMGLVQSLNDEKTKRDDAALKTENTKSIIAKRNSGGGGGGTKVKVTVPSASAEIKKYLKPISQGGVLGDDQFMDPNKWIELRDNWVTNKLPVATFNTLYKRYLNPLSYEKAGFAKPASSRTL